MKNKEVKLEAKDYWELYKFYILAAIAAIALIIAIIMIVKWGKKSKKLSSGSYQSDIEGTGFP
jgi:uncharacterized protein YpmS